MTPAAPGDVLDDLFPGSGAVTRAWDIFTSETSQQAPNDASTQPKGDAA